MNLGYNQLELSSIYNQLKSKNPHQQELAAKSLALFIHRNRNGGDDLLKKISTLLHPNSAEINDSVLFKVIDNVLKVLKDNTTLIINFLNMIFPLLFHIVNFLNRSIEEFEQTTKTIGLLVQVGGNHLSQVIENNVSSLFDRFTNSSFKYEYTRYASLSLLKEFTKNAPVIVFNKIVEKFEEFIKILENFRDSKQCIREASALVLEEFLNLLNNRDIKIKDYYTSTIYNRLIDKAIDSSDLNSIHGCLLMLKTFCISKSYFDSIHQKAMQFVTKHKNNKALNIRLTIVELIPVFAATLETKFEAVYLNSIIEHFSSCLISKTQTDIRSNIYLTLGKLSTIMKKESFVESLHKIMKIVKAELEKPNKVCLQIYTCLAKFMTNFPEIVLSHISYEEVVVNLFSFGFFESQCVFLEKLLQYYDPKSKQHINILMAVLNVISIIISEKKFHFNETNMYLKNHESEIGGVIVNNNLNHSFNLKGHNSSLSMALLSKGPEDSLDLTSLNSSAILTNPIKKERKMSVGVKSLINREFINNSRTSIKDYIISIISNSKLDSFSLASIMIQNSLQFLKIINHEFFFKDILTFYTEHCLKYLIDPVTAKKEITFSLANAKWIPDFRQDHLDYDQEFKLNIIVDAYLNVLLNDISDEIKVKLISLLDERFYKVLASNNFFEKVTLILNFDDNTLKEKVVALIGNLLEYNFTTIIVFIKKTILEIFNTILLSLEKSDTEEAVVLLCYFVRYSGKHILDYIELILPQLISVLKQSVNEENDILNISILSIVSELIIHNKNSQNMKTQHLNTIIEVCIENLKDNSNLNKQEISLKTVLSILENASVKFKIYFDHPKLVNGLIELLTKDSSKISRNLALRIFGYIGAMDNENLEKIWSIHKIETNFLNENYEVDEYNNIDDQEIIDHQRKKIKHEMVINKMEAAKNSNTKKPKNDKVDFEKLIADQEIDPCTYYAVRALVDILNEENMETGVHVIQFLGNLIKSLQDSEHPVVDLIFITLIERIVDYDSNLVKAIFDIFMIILKNFKATFKNHLKEILNTIEIYIDKQEFQIVVFTLLVRVFDNFGYDMKEYFPHWIPKLVSILFDNINPSNKDRNSQVSKFIFQCFAICSPYLGNYLSLIINDVIKLLSFPLDAGIMGSFDNNKSMPKIKQPSNIYLYPQLVKELSQNSHNTLSSQAEDFSQEDILSFLENILSLPALTQYLPKIVMGLLKFMETYIVNVVIVEKVMKLFIKMASTLKKKFIIFLPSIIRSTKHMNIPLNVFFNKIRLHVEQDSISVVKLRTLSESVGLAKSEGQAIIEKRERLESFQNEKFDREAIIKNRKNQMDKDRLVKEFDPSNCSIEEDWREWFKSSVKSLFWESPSYAIHYCYNVLDYYLPLHTELYNYAFISCWRNLNDHQKLDIITCFDKALKAPRIPKEILLTILNLSEYIEREENIEFINFSNLGDVAINCKAYAKALYYKETDFRANNDYETLEDLISLYYQLKLPEAAYGILKMTKQVGKSKQLNDDDWIIKLRKWNVALGIFNAKLEKDQRNPTLLKGKITCLEGLCDWENLINLSDSIEKSEMAEGGEELLNSSIPILVRASMNLGEWDRVGAYINRIKPDSLDEDLIYEKNLFSAIISIKEEKFIEAQKFIEASRNIIDDKIKTLLSESYERAYNVLLENQHLYELEELIQYKTGSSNMTRDKLYNNWKSRLENVSEEVKGIERILAIRSLVFDLNEDYENHLHLAKICMREDRFSSCLNILNRLDQRLNRENKDVRIRVQLSMNKCKYENNKKLEAISNLEAIMSSEMENIQSSLKSKIYSTCATWKMAQLETQRSFIEQEKEVKEILQMLQSAYQYNSKNYRAWHNYGLLNFKYFEELSVLYDNSHINTNYINTSMPDTIYINELKDSYQSKLNSAFYLEYAKNAIIGFTNAVRIGGTNISRTLQDLLRMIELSFMVGHKDDIANEIYKAIDVIEIEAWILVIPQLLARVHNLDDNLKQLLSVLFKKISDSHPRSLIYPLTVMSSSKNSKRRQAARDFLIHIKLKNKKLTDECSLIINELNRCALLMHEEWAEAIEESANLLFKKNDIEGMVNILMTTHDKMKTPTTLNEIHFQQLFAADLLEAKAYLQRYLLTENTMDLKQSWDIYHSVYKSIDESFQKINYLDLENISPKLFNFNESEICIPGMYKPGYPIIKIKSFENTMTVLNSKQHPRRMVIYGSEGKEYNFLLKGHEDLRQDESAMQLFSLVNTLLANDPDTETKNMFIKRCPIIPLSQNTGLIGWIANCDTLHQLIKEYRTSNNIIQDAEKRLIMSMSPKFETCAFLNKLEVFKHALDHTVGLDLNKVLWKKSKNSEVWLDRRTNYSRSLAVMSIVGYILGLGDRHPSNLMLDRISGKITHIDFGDCFEVAMKRDKFPEKVPFRLTRMLINALEVSGIEGTFRLTCENVMRVLRANKHSLIAILAAFLHNPLISFRLQIPTLIKAQKNKNTALIPQEERVSESLKKERIDEDFEVQNPAVEGKAKATEKLKQQSGIELRQNENEEVGARRRKMESNERQLFNRFEERDEIEFEELNKIAKIVLARIRDKLQGTDFSNLVPLNVNDQVEKLIKQATSAENLCQNYIGWCPYW